eukprot:jgi/Mesvir1/639/Mv17256-RA.2
MAGGRNSAFVMTARNDIRSMPRSRNEEILQSLTKISERLDDGNSADAHGSCHSLRDAAILINTFLEDVNRSGGSSELWWNLTKDNQLIFRTVFVDILSPFCCEAARRASNTPSPETKALALAFAALCNWFLDDLRPVESSIQAAWWQWRLELVAMLLRRDIVPSSEARELPVEDDAKALHSIERPSIAVKEPARPEHGGRSEGHGAHITMAHSPCPPATWRVSPLEVFLQLWSELDESVDPPAYLVRDVGVERTILELCDKVWGRMVDDGGNVGLGQESWSPHSLGQDIFPPLLAADLSCLLASVIFPPLPARTLASHPCASPRADHGMRQVAAIFLDALADAEQAHIAHAVLALASHTGSARSHIRRASRHAGARVNDLLEPPDPCWVGAPTRLALEYSDGRCGLVEERQVPVPRVFPLALMARVLSHTHEALLVPPRRQHGEDDGRSWHRGPRGDGHCGSSGHRGGSSGSDDHCCPPHRSGSSFRYNGYNHSLPRPSSCSESSCLPECGCCHPGWPPEAGPCPSLGIFPSGKTWGEGDVSLHDATNSHGLPCLRGPAGEECREGVVSQNDASWSHGPAQHALHDLAHKFDVVGDDSRATIACDVGPGAVPGQQQHPAATQVSAACEEAAATAVDGGEGEQCGGNEDGGELNGSDHVGSSGARGDAQDDGEVSEAIGNEEVLMGPNIFFVDAEDDVSDGDEGDMESPWHPPWTASTHASSQPHGAGASGQPRGAAQMVGFGPFEVAHTKPGDGSSAPQHPLCDAPPYLLCNLGAFPCHLRPSRDEARPLSLSALRQLYAAAARRPRVLAAFLATVVVPLVEPLLNVEPSTVQPSTIQRSLAIHPPTMRQSTMEPLTVQPSTLERSSAMQPLTTEPALAMKSLPTECSSTVEQSDHSSPSWARESWHHVSPSLAMGPSDHPPSPPPSSLTAPSSTRPSLTTMVPPLMDQGAVARIIHDTVAAVCHDHADAYPVLLRDELAQVLAAGDPGNPWDVERQLASVEASLAVLAPSQIAGVLRAIGAMAAGREPLSRDRHALRVFLDGLSGMTRTSVAHDGALDTCIGGAEARSKVAGSSAVIPTVPDARANILSNGALSSTPGPAALPSSTAAWPCAPPASCVVAGSAESSVCWRIGAWVCFLLWLMRELGRWMVQASRQAMRKRLVAATSFLQHDY